MIRIAYRPSVFDKVRLLTIDDVTMYCSPIEPYVY